ncbi:MAG: hypothetical protein ACRDGV_09140 [Candidatus Limnocylindria bacterium]
MGILAYIDPGSGSMLLQVLLAGALSIPFFFRRTIGNVVTRLRGGPDRQDAERADGHERSER